jgi:hypothetical protein
MKNLQNYSDRRRAQARKITAQLKAKANKSKPIALTPNFLQASLSLEEKRSETFYIPFSCSLTELKLRYSTEKPIKLQLTLASKELKSVFTYEDSQKEGEPLRFVPLAIAEGELLVVELLEGDPLYVGLILYPEKELMSFYEDKEASVDADSQDTKPLS